MRERGKETATATKRTRKREREHEETRATEERRRNYWRSSSASSSTVGHSHWRERTKEEEGRSVRARDIAKEEEVVLTIKLRSPNESLTWKERKRELGASERGNDEEE